MTREITAEPLTAEAFAPFGDVLELRETPDKMINAGLCGRHHDLAALDFGPEGRAGISLFDAQPRSFPYELTLLERHPEGSQAFVPLTEHPFLVIVAPDQKGKPGTPRAFLTTPHQGINFHRGTWHGVLTPLHAPGLFAVVDRIGATPNLEEIFLDPPYIVVP
ncbi:ureidoglycolate lyase [Sulfitobacter mediterraneus]|uniref:ureidoglycolate lyase n=1 Tax=Sulfitobacter mediterraneus TaxID=83219 RepID=UPI001931D9FB|nr:ureidoglycolate lyase [Sulfitobacter mediterraneus]MBM1632623.1 ureidoglycolate lyase [Sulfitobacter mediterraneus]MBM1641243.1 ureidoglycolate lyase [Sulfitobacter mediterraneus]MBM1644488.1 ureidoglycolate lyase [Sulfitobacter mediterraneus]MBM1649363.1 ureidoglycolate lyase [Sulfitobacter mediterraneus]MBM1653384.1 ureidoglycolate lyase [Sulfitobacter mediterraneus]